MMIKHGKIWSLNHRHLVSQLLGATQPSEELICEADPGRSVKKSRILCGWDHATMHIYIKFK